MLRFRKLPYRVVYPGNWQAVGPRTDILIRRGGRDAECELCVLSLDTFERQGAARAPAFVTVPITHYRDALGGRLPSSLPDGDYVICLREARTAQVLCVSGIRVRARMSLWAQCFDRMLEHRSRRTSAGSCAGGNGSGGEPLFSILTTVYDTEPGYLEELGRTIAAQRFPAFEWLLLDNGSRRAETVAATRKLASSDARFRGFRVERNLHIIGGNRYLFERARGRYVLTVDHDDLLYPDSLALLAERCVLSTPDFCYSDEHKVGPLGEPMELVWRPAWSRLFAMATCPAAHLMAYRRELGAAVGVYSGEYARGSQDWDTLLRLVDAGAKPARVQEVLYGWRMHPESSALDARSKRYLDASQKDVLRQSLRRRNLERRFSVGHARGALGSYHLVRKRSAPRPLAVDFVLRGFCAERLDNLRHNLRRISYPDVRVRVLQLGSAADARAVRRPRRHCDEWIVLHDARQLGDAASEIPRGAYAKAVIDCRLRLDDRDWAWDAIGTLELDADTGIVTGPVLTENARIVSIGMVAGLDGFFGTPLPGEPLDAVPGTLGYTRRNVTAAYSGLMMIRAGVTERCGNLLSIDEDDVLYGIEFCMRCQRAGILTGYTPRMRAGTRAPLVQPVGVSDPALRDDIIERYRDLLAEDPYYARYLINVSHRYAELDPCCAD